MSDTTDTITNTKGRSRLGIIFLTLFLDLVGFSIIFPLFPAMLEYYLPSGDGGSTLLGLLIAPLAAWAESSGATNPRFMTAVLFGGILGSLYSILQFICAPLWGAYSDRVGRRKVLLITISGLAFAALAGNSDTIFNTSSIFGFLAISLAAINIFGGFLVTQRMLAMYKKKKKDK